MCRAFLPFTMQGIYFSLKTSFQIKISPFHLSLLQSHHIPREQKPRYAKKQFFLFYYIVEKPEKVFRISYLTSSIIPSSPSSDYAFPQGLLLHVITGRFGLIRTK